MGNNTIKDVLDYEREKEYRFFGRQNEINEVKELLEKKDIVQIFGMTKIGKSRVLVQLLADFCQERTCFYHDFKEDNLENCDILIKLLQDFQKEIQGVATDKCFVDGNPPNVSSAMNQLKGALKKYGAKLTRPVLLLDNLEIGFMNKSLKDDILTVLKDISTLKGCEMKVIFTTSEKISMQTKTFAQIEVCQLDDYYIGEILRDIIEAKGTTLDEHFDFGEGILSEENQIYLDIIIKQCEGLPFIASMVAMELTADEGMLTPIDMVQLLFNQRVKSLSLEYYPPEDRIDLFMRDVEKVQDLDKYFLKTLNQHLDENNRKSLESLRSEFTRHDDKAKMEITKCFKLLTQPCIVRFLGKSREIDMHGIFRQCICEMTETDDIDDGIFRKLLMDNAKRYGLDLSDKHLENPKLLEEYVNKLGEIENANENLIACESRDLKQTHLNIVDKSEESKDDDHEDTHSIKTCLIAQPSDQTDETEMCERCNKMKQQFSCGNSDDRYQTEMSSKTGNIDLNNVDYCSCRPKLNDLKFIDSIEDNTAVPEVHDNLFMKTSAFMRTSLDKSDIKLHNYSDDRISSSIDDHVTAPKINQVSSDENQVMSSEFKQEEVGTVKFGRLTINSLLNSQFTTNHPSPDCAKRCNVGLRSPHGQNESAEDNHPKTKPNFDTLLNEKDSCKKVLMGTQMARLKSADSHLEESHANLVDVEENIGDLDFETLLDSTDSAKLHRLNTPEISSNPVGAEVVSVNSSNQFAMSYTINYLTYKDYVAIEGAKDFANSINE